MLSIWESSISVSSSHLFTFSSPSQRSFFIKIAGAAQARTKFHILLSNLGIVAIELLSRRPNLLVGGFLFTVVFNDSFAAEILEEERTLLHARVHLTIQEDAIVDVALCSSAEHLVLGHDALVHLIDCLEVFFGCILVTEDLIRHGGLVVSVRNETLDEQEVRTIYLTMLVPNGYCVF